MQQFLPPVGCVQLFTRSPTTFDDLTPYRISLGAVIFLRLREFCESFYTLYFCDGQPYLESPETPLQNSFSQKSAIPICYKPHKTFCTFSCWHLNIIQPFFLLYLPFFVHPLIFMSIDCFSHIRILSLLRKIPGRKTSRISILFSALTRVKTKTFIFAFTRKFKRKLTCGSRRKSRKLYFLYFIYKKRCKTCQQRKKGTILLTVF